MAKYLNIGFFIIMLVMNYLANALPLNNKTTGQLSDSLPNLFVPAGITFSIWGLIYLLLIIYCIIQFTASDQQVIDKISWLFGLSCMFNALWIVVYNDVLKVINLSKIAVVCAKKQLFCKLWFVCRLVGFANVLFCVLALLSSAIQILIAHQGKSGREKINFSKLILSIFLCWLFVFQPCC